MKYSVEMGQFSVEYCPQTAIKGEALADFIAEFTYQLSDDDLPVVPTAVATPTWTLYVDDSSNHMGSGAGIVFISPKNHRLHMAYGLPSRPLTMKLNMKHSSPTCPWLSK